MVLHKQKHNVFPRSVFYDVSLFLSLKYHPRQFSFTEFTKCQESGRRFGSSLLLEEESLHSCLNKMNRSSARETETEDYLSRMPDIMLAAAAITSIQVILRNSGSNRLYIMAKYMYTALVSLIGL